MLQSDEDQGDTSDTECRSLVTICYY